MQIVVTGNNADGIASRELWDAYSFDCFKKGEKRKKRWQFNGELQDQGARLVQGTSGYWFYGVRLERDAS